jgi:hypothetical protein
MREAWGAVVLQPQPYARMVRTLREFEGWRSLWWRIPASALAFIAVPVLAIGAGVLAAAISGDDFGVGRAVVAAVVATLASTYIHARLSRRQLHRTVVADPLWTWEKPNPATQVQVLVRECEVEDAKAVLRRTGFNPGVFMTRLSTPPADAQDLNVRVGVEEPEAHPQSSSDADRVRRMARALGDAGIRARVAGRDVPSRAVA